MLSNGLNSFFHWLTFLVKSRNGLQVTNYIQQTLFHSSEFSLKNNSMGKNGQKSRLFCHYDINMYMSLFDLVDVTFAEDCLWKQNSAGNFIGKYIRWVWNSSKKKEFWLKIQLQLTSELQLIPITYSKVTSCLSLIGMNYQSNKNAYLN